MSQHCLLCRSGGTGRRMGLKIPREQNSRTGSIPVSGTITYFIETSYDFDSHFFQSCVIFMLSLIPTKKGSI